MTSTPPMPATGDTTATQGTVGSDPLAAATGDLADTITADPNDALGPQPVLRRWGTVSAINVGPPGTMDVTVGGTLIPGVSSLVGLFHVGTQVAVDFVGTDVMVAGGKDGVSPLERAFPIGCVYLTYTNTNPATFLGLGTWTAVGPGRMLASVGTGAFSIVAGNNGSDTILGQHLPVYAAMGIRSPPIHTHGYTIATGPHPRQLQRRGGMGLGWDHHRVDGPRHGHARRLTRQQHLRRVAVHPVQLRYLCLATDSVRRITNEYKGH